MDASGAESVSIRLPIMTKIDVFSDKEALLRAVAERIVVLAKGMIAAQGQFSIGLSGGSTPRPLFELLATNEFASRLDWANIHVFWGDERAVPPDHADSNYRMTREALLDHVDLPETNIHRIRGEIDPVQAAAEYEQVLRVFFDQAAKLPRFDLLLLGMGSDGHTASLFPGTDALREKTRWVRANYVPKLDAWRITLTLPAINAAAQVWFLVAGQSKAETLQAVLHGPRQPQIYPAQLVQPDEGELAWLVDAAAASLL
jgi:6-phosphogluconolactonase